MAAPAIEISHLTKQYGDNTAVDNLTLKIARGEVFGLLGPNGAGKTTTILTLLGLTEPTVGDVRVAGLDPARDPLGVKRITGYMPDSVGFYDELTGRQNLRYTAELNLIPPREAETRIDDLLQRVRLFDVGNHNVGTYSRGMRQRLGLADVLLKKPQVVILDEPTLGLDPTGALEFLDLIRSLSGEGLTVMLSSHLLHQVQQICDRVGIFVKGKMIACGRVSELADQALKGQDLRLVVETAPCPDSLLAALKGIDGVKGLSAQDDGYIQLTCSKDVRAQVVRLVTEQGVDLLHLHQEGRTLDDIYRLYFQGEEDRRAKNATVAASGIA